MATERTADQMEELGRLFAGAGIKDVTLPVVSFFRSREITNLLRKYTNNIRIEDLWRPYFSVSTSLANAEPVIHTTGPLWRAARASSAIPGLFSPVPTSDGDLLVDGGIMNNAPVDVMRGLCQRGPVIGINLDAHSEKAARYNFGPSLSGWRVLWSRFNPFAETIQAPSIFTTLLRTTEAGSIHRMRTGEVLGQADLLISPPVEQYRLLDFGSCEALIRVGYDTTRAVLDSWLSENPSLRPRLGLGSSS
jgi:predicted acylesterase/phospholipase RssA